RSAGVQALACCGTGNRLKPVLQRSAEVSRLPLRTAEMAGRTDHAGKFCYPDQKRRSGNPARAASLANLAPAGPPPMALDPYDPCPCGSGKKFKWCCQPIYAQIDKAFQLDADNQHEMALRTMEQACAEHPTNPEVWGRKAQMLYQMDKVEEAENALEKAFA